MWAVCSASASTTKSYTLEEECRTLVIVQAFFEHKNSYQVQIYLTHENTDNSLRPPEESFHSFCLGPRDKVDNMIFFRTWWRVCKSGSDQLVFRFSGLVRSGKIARMIWFWMNGFRHFRNDRIYFGWLVLCGLCHEALVDLKKANKSSRAAL